MKLEKALYETDIKGKYRVEYVLVDDKFNIQQESLFYSNYLRANGYSPNTIEGYLRDLRIFFDFLEYKGLRFNEIKPLHIIDYLDYLKGYKEENIIYISNENKQRSSITVNRMLASVSSFYKCLETADMTEKSPFVYIDGVRPNGIYKSFLSYTKSRKNTKHKFVKSKENYSNVSMERLFPNEVRKFKEGMKTYRDKLIVDILYETGIRIGELLGLQLDDYTEVDVSEKFGFIHIIKREENDSERRQKTGSRTLPVTMDLLSKIDEYVTEYRPYVDDSKLLFVAEKGKNKGTQISRARMENIFRECSINSKIKCHPHLLRHTHLTELAEAGFDQLFIQMRAGHSNPSSTERYKHPSIEVQSKAYQRFITYRKGVNMDGD